MAAVLVFLALGHAFASEPLTPDAAVRQALERSTEVASAESALGTARGQRAQDGVFLTNPEISYSASLTTPRQELDVSQALSLTGEGWQARASDRAGVDAATATLARTRLVVAATTRGAWADAVIAADRARVAREALDLATRLREAVDKKLAVGEASDLDARLSRLTEASAASAWIAARREEDAARLALVALIGDATGDLAGDPLLAAPVPTGGGGTRGDVVAADARVQATEAALRRARAAALPAIRVGAYVEHDGPELAVGPTLGIEIPVWGRNQAEISARAGDAAVARREADQARATSSFEGASASVRAKDAESVAPLGATSMLEDARAALAAVDAGYRSGELSLSDAIQLRTQVLDGERAVLDLAGELVRARLDLLLATEDPALLPEAVR